MGWISVLTLVDLRINSDLEGIGDQSTVTSPCRGDPPLLLSPCKKVRMRYAANSSLFFAPRPRSYRLLNIL